MGPSIANADSAYGITETLGYIKCFLLNCTEVAYGCEILVFSGVCLELGYLVCWRNTDLAKGWECQDKGNDLAVPEDRVRWDVGRNPSLRGWEAACHKDGVGHRDLKQLLGFTAKSQGPPPISFIFSRP